MFDIRLERGAVSWFREVSEDGERPLFVGLPLFRSVLSVSVWASFLGLPLFRSVLSVPVWGSFLGLPLFRSVLSVSVLDNFLGLPLFRLVLSVSVSGNFFGLPLFFIELPSLIIDFRPLLSRFFLFFLSLLLFKSRPCTAFLRDDLKFFLLTKQVTNSTNLIAVHQGSALPRQADAYTTHNMSSWCCQPYGASAWPTGETCRRRNQPMP